MSFTRNTLLASIFAITTLASVAHDARSCPPGRSGGYTRSYSSRSYSRPSYNSYSTPSYQSYSQPTYHNSYSQPVRVVRNVQSQQSIPTQPVQAIQPQFQQVSQPQQQPIQPQQQSVAPRNQLAPQQQLQVQPQTAPQQQPITPQQQPTTNPAAMSALQALGGFAPPQQTVAPIQPQKVAAHVGTWTASLGNGSTVQLTLQNDGNFTWVATNKSGGSSNFSGSYTVGNGTLNLNRSNDNQQLGGSMTTNGNNAFSFKVAGNNAASINFNRS